MKKFYETAEVEVFLFEKKDVVMASSADSGSVVTTTTEDSDETELL